MGPAPTVDVRRAADRAVTAAPGLVSRHSFAFGDAPGDTHHGLLLAHNEDTLGAGAGYAPHTHRDVEIVTWVLAGELVHRADGRDDVVGPGTVQRLGAGGGLEHAEVQHGDAPLHVLQVWLLPDEVGGQPLQERRDVSGALAGGDLVAVASGLPRDASGPGASLGVRSSAVHAARPPAGRTVEVPDAPYLHVFLARGRAVLADPPADDAAATAELTAGDAVRLTGRGARLRVTADADLLVVEMHEALGG